MWPETGSQLTLCWRGMDSKFQFRDASPPPTAWAPSFRRVSGGSLSRRNSSIGLARPTTARVIPPPRRPSIRPNPTEATKPLPIWRGTEISNPFPSSGESDELGDLCQPQRMSRLSAPTRRSKIPRPPGNRPASVRVADVGGEEFEEAHRHALAGRRHKRRHGWRSEADKLVH